MRIFKPQNGPGELDARDISMYNEARDQPFNRQRSRDSSGSEGQGTRQQEYDSRIFRRHSGNKRVEFEDEVLAQQRSQHNRDAGHPYKRPQRRSGDWNTEDELPFKGFNPNFGSIGGNRNDQRNQGRFGNRDQRDRRDNYRDIRQQYRNDHDDRGNEEYDRRDNYRDVRIKQRNDHDDRGFENGDGRGNFRDVHVKQRNEHDDRGDHRDRQDNYRNNRQNQRNNDNRYDRQDSWGNNRDHRPHQRNENDNRNFVRSNSFGGGDRLARNNNNQGEERVTRSKSFRGRGATHGERNDENRAPQHNEKRNQENVQFVSYYPHVILILCHLQLTEARHWYYHISSVIRQSFFPSQAISKI